MRFFDNDSLMGGLFGRLKAGSALNRPKRYPFATRHSLMLSLEPRLVYDGALAPTAEAIADSHDTTAADTHNSGDTHDATDAHAVEQAGVIPGSQTGQGLELAFIDRTLVDAQTLAASLQGKAQIIWLDPAKDGVIQIGEALSHFNNVSAIHIFSHADKNGVSLGNIKLTDNTVDAYASNLQSWSGHLTENADILVYGCNLAETDAGKSLVGKLADYTGADIAASDDLTGATSAGGDWQLETRTGQIDTFIIDARDYQSILTNPVITGLSENLTVTETQVDYDGTGATTIIDSSITLTSGLANYNGWTLDVTATGSNNIFDIIDEGSAAGQISTSGSNLMYGGIVIGTFTGENTGHLIVTFNSNADNAAVDHLIERIGYGVNSSSPDTVREITFKLADGGSNIATFSTHVALAFVPIQTITTSDGKNVYVLGQENVSGNLETRIAVYDRNASTGALTYSTTLNSTVLDAARMTLSADGKNIYIIANQGLIEIDRNTTTGALTLDTVYTDIAAADGKISGTTVVVSPDNSYVLISSDAADSITAYTRDPVTGALTLAADFTATALGLAAGSLDRVHAMTVSADGLYMYVIGANAAHTQSILYVFRYNPTAFTATLTSQLTLDNTAVTATNHFTAISISADGRHIYATRPDTDRVYVLSRGGSGTVNLLQTLTNNSGGNLGLDGVTSVAVAGDGQRVYFASKNSDAVSVYRRNPITGVLSYVGMMQDGVAGVNGLNGATSVALSDDGEHIYAVGALDQAIATMETANETIGIVSLSVIAENDPLLGLDRTIGVAEGVAYTFSAATFGITDPDGASGTFTSDYSVRINSLPVNGTLTFNGIDVVLNQEIPSAQFNLLVYTATVDGSWTEIDTISYTPKDVDGIYGLDKVLTFSTPGLLFNKYNLNPIGGGTAVGGSTTPNAALYSAGDTSSVPFTGTVTAANVNSFFGDATYTNIDAGDTVRFALVLQNISPSALYDLVIADVLPAGFSIPGGGLNLRVVNGAGETVSFTLTGGATTDADALFGSGIQLDQATGAGTDGRDILIITYDLAVDTGNLLGNSVSTNATLSAYSLTDGGGNDLVTPISDGSQLYIAEIRNNATTIVSTSNSETTGTYVTPGEVVTMRATFDVRGGVAQNVVWTAVGDPDGSSNAFAFVRINSISASGSLSTSVSGGWAAVIDSLNVGSYGSAAAIDAGRAFSLNFGTITNSDSNDGTTETVTILFDVVMISNAAIGHGASTDVDTFVTYNSRVAEADGNNVTNVIPAVAQTLVPSQPTAQIDDVFTYTYTFTPNTARQILPHDSYVTIVLNPALDYMGNFTMVGGSNPIGAPDIVGNTITVRWDDFVSGNVSFTFDVKVNGSAPLGRVQSSATVTFDTHPGTRTDVAGNTTTLDNERTLTLTSNFSVNVVYDPPAMSVVGSDNPNTTGTTVTVGETVRIRYVTQIPASSTADVRVNLDVPAGMQFLDNGNVKIAFVSSTGGMTSSTTGLSGAGLQVVGDETNVNGITPTFTFPSARLYLTGANTNGPFTDGQDVTLRMQLTNTETDMNYEYIVLEYDAVVTNVATNIAGAALVTRSTLSNGTAVASTSPDLTFNVVEPAITGVTKSIINTDGTTLTYQVTFTNSSAYSAYDVSIRDALPTGLSNFKFISAIGSGSFSSFTDSSTSNGGLSLVYGEVGAGASITVTYTVDVGAQNVVASDAIVEWTSMPGANANERDGDGGVDTYLVSESAGVNAITGTLWHDTNGSNVVNGGEPRIAGVQMNLTWSGTDGIFGTADDRYFSTFTNSSGVYNFYGIIAGTYMISAQKDGPNGIPGGLGSSYDPVGAATDNLILVTADESGVIHSSRNFGLRTAIAGFDTVITIGENNANAAPQIIDSAITFYNIASSYAGWSITLATDGGTDDQLAIRNVGTGAGQIGISGSNITYGGTVIGTFTGGTNGTTLTITLNANANAAAMEILLENLTYANASDNPVATRNLTLNLVDPSPDGDLVYINYLSDESGEVGGYDFIRKLIIHPSGRFAYGTSDTSEITIFSRNPNTGALTYLSVVADGVNGVDYLNEPWDLQFSADGKFAYATSPGDNAITIFSINTATGAMSVVGNIINGSGGVTGLDGPTHLTIAADNTVYVAGTSSSSIVTFTRDPLTGMLTYRNTYTDGAGGISSLDDVFSLTISGNYLYATSAADDAITVFERGSNGVLTLVADYAYGRGGIITFSPDNAFAYLASPVIDTITIFSVNASTGALTFVQSMTGTSDLDGVLEIVFSADGRFGYIVTNGENRLVVYSRDAATGALTFVKSFEQGQNGIAGMDIPSDITMSADGSFIYVSAPGSDSIAYFKVHENQSLELSTVLNVTAQNDAPIGTPKTVTIYEDTSHTFTAADFGFTDVDNADALSAIRIDTLPAAGQLRLSGVLVTAGQIITAAQIANLTYTPWSEGNGSPYTTFTFSVRDAALAYDVTPKTITLNVLSIYDPLKLTYPTLATFNENTVNTLGQQIAATSYSFGDRANFDGFVVRLTGSGLPEDQFGIQNQGTGTNQIGISGSNVTFQGTVIGTYSGGTNGTDLVITLNANSNRTSLYLLGRAITYANTSDNPTFQRTTTYSITDTNPAGTLTIVRTQYDGSSGGTTLATPNDLIFSPNGNFAYVMSSEDAISIFRRDSINNELFYVGSVSNNVGGVTGIDSAFSGVFSADGQFMYVTGTDSDSVAIFSANAATGALTFIGTVENNVGGVTGLDAPTTITLSADGKTLLVTGTAGDSIVTFTRNATTGALTYAHTYTDGVGGITTLDGVRNLTAIPSTNFIYAISETDNAITLFTLDSDTGALTKVSEYTHGSGGVTHLTTPYAAVYVAANSQLIVTSQGNSAITVFNVDAGTGALTQAYVYANNQGGITNFNVPRDLDISADGKYVYVSTPGSSALNVFSRDTTTGALTQLSTTGSVWGSSLAAISPDGTHLYASLNGNNSIATYRVYTNETVTAAPTTIRVNAENDLPTGTNNSATLDEDTVKTFSAADFIFTDVDNASSLSAVRIDTLPALGLLKLNGVNVTAGQIILTADLANLTYTPALNGNGVAYASFTFSIRDNANGYDAAPNTYTFNVNAVPDPPAGTNRTYFGTEDSAINFVANDFGFTDPDGDTFKAVRIDTLPATGSLTLSGVAVTAGQVIQVADIANLRYNPVLNANGTVGNFTFSVQDSTDTYDPTPNTMTLSLTAVNDAPTGADKTITTNEDTAYTFVAADFGFTDIDTGDTISAVRIDTLPAAGTLRLSGVAITAGQVILAAQFPNLTYTPALNANGAAYASFTFSVRDQGSAFDASPNTITFNVTAVNDTPLGTNKTVTLVEEGSYTFAANDFGFTDVDTGDTLSGVRIDTLPAAGTLTLSGVAVTAGQVITAAQIGNLVFTPALNANGATYASFTFSVGDQSSAYDPAPNTITVSVTAVNDAPLGADNTVTTNEDTAYIFAAANFGFTDVDAGDTLSAVRIDTLPTNGTLRLSGVAVTAGQIITAANIANLTFTPALNANGNAYASFTFSVRDQSSVYDTAPNTITVNVTPVNDAPTGADNTVTTLEDTGFTFAASDFGFTDVDTGDTISAIRIDALPASGTLTLSGVAVTAGQIITTANIGNLVYTPALNANGNAAASFTFSVRDQSSAYDAAPNTITVNVTPVNDAPVGTSRTLSTNEDTPYTFAAANFGFTDVDTGDTLSAIRIDTLPPLGSLTLNGVAVTAGQVVLTADIGNLVFTPVLNENGNNYVNFTFSVRDQSGAYDASPKNIKINVNAVNDTPLGADKTVTTNEDTGFTFAANDFGFNDVDTGDTLSAIRIDTLPIAGSLTLSGVAVTAGQIISAASIGNLVYTPALNANGNAAASFTFSVRDSANAFDTVPNAITVNVTPVNDAPLGANKTVTTNEDTAFTFAASDFGFTDVDTGDTLSAVRIDTLPVNGTLTLNGVAVTAGDIILSADIANLAFTPALNANGNTYASFTFSVRDQSSAYDAAPNTITVNVTPVNDTPLGADNTVTTNEDTTYTFAAANFGFTDVDTGDTLSAVRIDTLPANGTLRLSGVAVTAGQIITAANIANLTFTPAANANGNAYASFTFSVRDQSSAYDTAPNTLTVNVTPVNDAPTGANNTVTTNEDTGFTFAASDFGFSDIDTGDTLSGIRIDALPASGTLTLSGVAVTAGQIITTANIGNLVYTPALNANGNAYASFTFSVRDQSSAFDAAPNTITVNVTPVNDAPTGADKTVTTNEDAAYTFAASDFGFTDVDTGDTLSAIRVDALPAAGTLTLNGVAVTAGQIILSGDIADMVFTPALNANGAAYTTFTFSVRDQSSAYDAAPNTITVNVSAVNDTPLGADKTVTTNEDTAFTFAASDFGFTDVDTGDTLASVRIDTLPANGTLRLSGVAVTAGQVISAANIANLTFTPALNANGTGYTSFTFSVRDSANAYDATPNAITIDVTPVNDAPTGTNKTVTTNEDTAFTFAASDFGFTDVDTGDTLSAIRVDTLPLNGTLTLNGVAVNAGDIILSGDIANLAFAPAADANGNTYASFTFSVRDQSNAFDTAPNTITVNVTPVNDTPLGADNTVTTNEDTAYTFTAANFGFSDVDTGDTLSAVRIDTLPANGTLRLSGVAVTAGQIITAANIANLTFTPAANANGAGYATFSFSVRDQASAYDTAPNSMTINVTPVNDAPTGTGKTLVMDEDTAYTFKPEDFSFTDPDAGDYMTAIRIDSITGSGNLTLHGVNVAAGQVVMMADMPGLKFTPASNAYGRNYAAFTFSVRDAASVFAATPATMTIDVADVDDPIPDLEDTGPELPTETTPDILIPDSFKPVISRILYQTKEVFIGTFEAIMGSQTDTPDYGPTIYIPLEMKTFPPSAQFLTGSSSQLSLDKALLHAGIEPDNARVQLRMADGSAVPDWLQYDAASMTIVGVPPEGAEGKISLVLIITDSKGREILVPVELMVVAPDRAANADAPADQKADKSAQTQKAQSFSGQMARMGEAGRIARLQSEIAQILPQPKPETTER